MSGNKSPLDERLKQIAKDLHSVQDRIRELSKEEPRPAVGVAERGASDDPLPVAAAPTRPDPGGPEQQHPSGVRDRRFADYLASSFQANQTLRAERRAQRNKAIFMVGVVAVILALWALSRLL